MPNRLLAALVATVLILLPIRPDSVRAQYTAGLPQGISSVEVDGQPIDATTVPATSNAIPEISGRTDLGLPSLDLAVANGEVIRFQADVDNRGRFRASVPQRLTDGQYTLYINDLLIGAFTVAGAAEAGSQPGRLLDIARVVPYPVDFGDRVSGIGFLDGRFYSLHEEALRTAAAAGDDGASTVRDTERRLAEAGWLQRYENRLAAPSPDRTDTFTMQFSSFIVEYASGADAKTAFGSLVGSEQGLDFPTVGDESQLTTLSGVTPDTGTNYQAARLIFRLGPMLGMIVYADLTNQQPDLDLLAAVAQAVAARGLVVADRQTVPLGSMTLRLDASSATGRIARRDIYDVRGGDLTALYNQTADTLAARVDLYAGTTDAFASTTSGVFTGSGGDRGESQANSSATAPAPDASPPTPTSVIGIEGVPASPAPASPTSTPSTVGAAATPRPRATAVQALMSSALYAFPDDASADTWFVAQRDLGIATPQSGGVTLAAVPDAQPFGDASAVFTARRPLGAGDGFAEGYRIYARAGAIVAVLEMVSAPGVSLRGVTDLMELQMTCIEAQGCTGPAPLPGGLAGGNEERRTRPAANNRQEGTPSPQSGTGQQSMPSEAVITVEGEGTPAASTSAPTKEPKPSRADRPKKKDKKAQDAPAG